MKQKKIVVSISQALMVAMAGVSAPAMSVQLEEVIVTAQKRAESLQDVPISVAAMTGDKISDAGMRNLGDAIKQVPNVTIVGSEIGDSVNIRGIQSGNQAGFEQSVATFVDGVYRGRGVQSRFSFLDVERLEVLRGPQGVLFGKNVVAGALSITSAKPTDELTGAGKVSYNVDLDETEFTGYLSGALSDSVTARIAVLDRTMNEGWVENIRYGNDEPETDEQAARIYLVWDASDTTSVSYKLEHGTWDNQGTSWELQNAGSLAALGLEDSYNGKSAIGTNPLDPDPNQELGSSQLFDGDTTETSLTLNHSFADDGELTAIASYSKYTSDRMVDADISTLDTLNFNDEEDFEQKTFEIRYASNQEGAVEYIIGAFYLDADLVAEGNTPLGVSALNDLAGLSCAAGGGTTVAYDPNTDDPAVAAALAAATNAGLGTSAATASACSQATLAGPITALGVDGFNRYVKLDQNTESWATFGQLTWHMSETLRSTFGLRYTSEEKTASHSSVVSDYGLTNKAPSSDPLAGALAGLFGEYVPHSFDDLKRKETSWTWSANLQWDFSSMGMAYASASTGFKAGGFNSFYLSLAPDPSEIGFDEEEVLTFEIGAKLSLLDGAGEMNIAMYRSEYSDMQVSVFSGQTTYNVDNAAEAVTQGIEIDSRWQLTDELLLTASVGWIDFEFENFDNQGCTNAQYLAYREEAWAGGTNPAAAFLSNGDCAQAGVNDLSGRVAAQTPEFTGSVSLAYETSITDAWTLGLGMDVSYRDESYRQDDLDENSLDDASTQLNASVRLASMDGWTFMLNGNNLTDEESFTLSQDIPLASGSHFAQTIRPRTFTLSVKYEI
ncbi:TonB-dependent receptor [Maricurvus nonylphenolicus]|uniref:TonB-dependent receptor n=1 Tax=Maricurvus nonylphenolicus TaxID=1008307 RepID=UPI0036F3927E